MHGNAFRLADSAEVAGDRILRVAETPVGAVALVRIEGRVHALGDRCPHAAALLSQGFIERRALVCPTHFAAFDVETGAATDAPPGCRAAAVFSVVERDGGLFLA
jgi:nitrite reductase/ring-hydroxylating ferredoxin subunit